MKVHKNTHAFFEFTRQDYNGNAITSRPRELYFSVKETGDDDDEKYLIQKTMTAGDIVTRGNGEWQIRLIPKDTANLSLGRYFCDVKVIDEYGLNFIIVETQPFDVVKTITLSGG